MRAKSERPYMEDTASHTSITFSALGLLSSVALSSGRIIFKNTMRSIYQGLFNEINMLMALGNGNSNCRWWEKIFVVDHFLLKHENVIQEKVFWSASHLMNLTVDLIFFDTTNTYFEMEDPGESELLAFGKSKHKR
ncbi:MAG: hypothetical protein GY755_14105 [Chloroflexi bacterium]|nr:hypothetical protein [Chloroflexota bacterium]